MNKLLKLSESHYIVVDDSEIKEGDWVINGNNKIFQYTKESISGINYCKKITHSTEPLEVVDFICNSGEVQEEILDYKEIKSLSLSEVEEAINGYSVEKMAEKNFGTFGIGKERALCWEAGFKAHQELVKDKLFTVEDMREAFEAGTKCEDWIDDKEEYIQSLLPKTEWDVEFDEQGKLRLI